MKTDTWTDIQIGTKREGYYMETVPSLSSLRIRRNSVSQRLLLVATKGKSVVIGDERNFIGPHTFSRLCLRLPAVTGGVQWPSGQAVALVSSFQGSNHTDLLVCKTHCSKQLMQKNAVCYQTVVFPSLFNSTWHQFIRRQCLPGMSCFRRDHNNTIDLSYHDAAGGCLFFSIFLFLF